MLWLEHHTHIFKQPVIQLMIAELGMESYAAYWVIMEEISASVGQQQQDGTYNLSESLTYPVQYWRDLIKFTPKKFEKFIKFAEKTKLFSIKFDENSEKYLTLTIPKLLNLADTYTKRLIRKSEQCSNNVQDTIQYNTSNNTKRENINNTAREEEISLPEKSHLDNPKHQGRWMGELEQLCALDRSNPTDHLLQQIWFAARRDGADFATVANKRQSYIQQHKDAEEKGLRPNFAYGLKTWLSGKYYNMAVSDTIKCKGKPKAANAPAEKPQLTQQEVEQKNIADTLRSICASIDGEIKQVHRNIPASIDKPIVRRAVESYLRGAEDHLQKLKDFVLEKNLNKSELIAGFEAQLEKARSESSNVVPITAVKVGIA